MDTDAPHYYYQRRRDFTRYLNGDGVEIGALHNPLKVSGDAVTRIRYVDRYDIEGLREHYPELIDHPLVSVDIVDDGQVLNTVPDASLDFVIANSMIEHTDNPLGTIENWLAKLRPGGVVYLTVPDKRVGWDERRPLTSLTHMIEDYFIDAQTRKTRNAEHFSDWVTYIALEYDPNAVTEFTAATDTLEEAESRLKSHVQLLIEMDYSIHFHVFTHQSFRAMLDYARQVMHFPFEIADEAEPIPESWESIFILRKIDPATIPLRDAALDTTIEAAPEPTLAELQTALATAREELERTTIHAAQYHIRSSQQLSLAQIHHTQTFNRLREKETRLFHTEGALLEAQRCIIRLQGELMQVQGQGQTNNDATQLQERLDRLERVILPAKNVHILMLEERLRVMDSSVAVKIALSLNHRAASLRTRLRRTHER